MLIELLIVGAIMMYLNTLGFISYDSPWGIAVSIAILVFFGTISFLITHWIANNVVDGLFGFSGWSPKSTAKPKTEAFNGPADNREWLEDQIKKQPSNVALSKRLADLYLKSELIDKYVAERQRILREGKLSAPEFATIVNRLADLELDRNRPEGAIAHLREMVAKFPDANEAQNARVRISIIEEAIVARRASESAE